MLDLVSALAPTANRPELVELALQLLFLFLKAIYPTLKCLNFVCYNGPDVIFQLLVVILPSRSVKKLVVIIAMIEPVSV